MKVLDFFLLARLQPIFRIRSRFYVCPLIEDYPAGKLPLGKTIRPPHHLMRCDSRKGIPETFARNVTRR